MVINVFDYVSKLSRTFIKLTHVPEYEINKLILKKDKVYIYIYIYIYIYALSRRTWDENLTSKH